MSDLVIINDDEKLYVFDYKEDEKMASVYKIKGKKRIKSLATFPACLRFMPYAVVKEINK